MVNNLKIGKKTYEWKFISWDSGAAGCLSKMKPPRQQCQRKERIIGAAPDGRILGFFPPKKTGHELTPTLALKRSER